MSQEPNIEDLIRQRVDVALANRFRCELASPATGKPMPPHERRRTLTILFTEIAKGMGLERFLETPVERLGQFAVMSVVKNHDTSGLLRSLVNSFMIAYSYPETVDRAFAALLELEALRAEVAHANRQPAPNPMLVAAYNALVSFLAEKLPPNFSYGILYGADRLFVMAASPIQALPSEINGVPVEFRPRHSCHHSLRPKMKALSIRQPGAWLIVRPDLTDPAERAAAFAAGKIKDVENRTWATKHRGLFLVHAGQTFDMDGYLWVKSHFPKIPMPLPGQYELGGTIGQAELTDCIPPLKARNGQLTSRWYMGEHAFMVANPVAQPFRKVKGKLNFFEVSLEEIPS